MSDEIPKEILDAIARWVEEGRAANPLGQRVAQPVMQSIAYVPKQLPALPELPVLNLPAERSKVCCRVGCQQEAICENEVRIGERKSIAYLCSEHHAEVLAYALKMQELTGMPEITVETANQPFDDSTR